MEKIGFKKIGEGIYEGVKTLEFSHFETKSDQSGIYISGYANTKNQADAYGDIPTNYLDNPVYDLKTRFEKNPVALVDHERSVGHIFGVFVIGEEATYEDTIGLKFRLRLMDNPQTDIAKHAVEAYKSGFARAFSIGGKWLYEDQANPNHLTKAIIYEISGVAIGADASAISTTIRPKHAENTEAKLKQKVLEALISEYRITKSKVVLETIEKYRRT